MTLTLLWQIAVGLVLAVGTFSLYRFKTSSQGEHLKKVDEILEKYDEKLEKHGEDIRELQSERKQYLTAQDADNIYLRRKEFEQFEKHIDSRFDDIKDGQKELKDDQKLILNLLKGKQAV